MFPWWNSLKILIKSDENENHHFLYYLKSIKMLLNRIKRKDAENDTFILFNAYFLKKSQYNSTQGDLW